MKVSIVTITYNRGHLIGDTIKSVLAQTHADFEHIIIDDGSSDNTEQVVNGFNEPRIKYFKYPKSGHRSFLRNEGFRKASGDFVSVLDSDDLWTSDKLMRVLEIFNKHPEVDFVIHDVGFISDTPYSCPPFPYKSDFKGNMMRDMLSNKVLPFPLFTIRKAAISQIGLIDEEMVDGQHDLYFRVAAQLTVYFIAAKLIFMRKHDQNISAKTDMTHFTDYLKTIEKLHESKLISAQQAAVANSQIHYKIGYIYNDSNNFAEAISHFKKSMGFGSINPYAVKSVFRYLFIKLKH